MSTRANQYALSAAEVYEKIEEADAKTLALIAIALALTEPKEALDTDLSVTPPPLSAASALR